MDKRKRKKQSNNTNKVTDPEIYKTEEYNNFIKKDKHARFDGLYCRRIVWKCRAYV
jgi:hypothetical protein